jgi:histidine phosphotransferase ChpT
MHAPIACVRKPFTWVGLGLMNKPLRVADQGDCSVIPAVDIDLRIAQLMCSRLCHDLVGPAGAVNAGVEFLDEANGHDAGALALVASSGRQVTRRLAFFRVAFGLAGGADGALSLAEARGLAEGMLAGGRVELDWPLTGAGADTRVPRPLDTVRLVLCQVLLAAGALPRGGGVEVRLAERREGLEAQVSAIGRDAGVGDDLLAAIGPDASPDELTARTVHGYYTARLAERLGTAIRIEDGKPDEYRLSALMPGAAHIEASAA